MSSPPVPPARLIAVPGLDVDMVTVPLPALIGLVPPNINLSVVMSIALLVDRIWFEPLAVNVLPLSSEIITPPGPETLPPRVTLPVLCSATVEPAPAVKLSRLPVLLRSILPVAVADRLLLTAVVKVPMLPPVASNVRLAAVTVPAPVMLPAVEVMLPIPDPADSAAPMVALLPAMENPLADRD